MEASQVTKFDTTQTGKYITKKKKKTCFGVLDGSWQLQKYMNWKKYGALELFFPVVLFDHQNTDIVWDTVCVYLYRSYFFSSTAQTHLKDRQKIKQHIFNIKTVMSKNHSSFSVRILLNKSTIFSCCIDHKRIGIGFTSPHRNSKWTSPNSIQKTI